MTLSLGNFYDRGFIYYPRCSEWPSVRISGRERPGECFIVDIVWPKIKSRAFVHALPRYSRYPVSRIERVHAGLLLVNTKNRERNSTERKGWKFAEGSEESSLLHRVLLLFAEESCATFKNLSPSRFTCTFIMYDSV